MAKLSMKAREAKRAKLVAKYAEKRAALKAIISSPESLTKLVGMRFLSCKLYHVIQAHRVNAIAVIKLAALMVSCANSA